MQEVIQEAVDRLHELFTYVPDKKNYMQEEHYTSHYQEYSDGIPFSDDCDGFAITAANILVKDLDIDKADVKLIICDMGVRNELHMVCGVDFNDQTYIIDCNYNNIYKFNTRKEINWLYFMQLDEPGQWYKIKS